MLLMTARVYFVFNWLVQFMVKVSAVTFTINTFMKRKTTEQFIKEAKQVHGNKYDYSLVEYTNTITPIPIICSEHGVFEQTPKRHIVGSGCPRCSGKNKTTEIFVENAKQVHGNRYDYSLVEYTRATDKIKIICHENNHGAFKQKPSDHLSGNGCPKCFIKRAKTTEQFIKEAREIHGDIYDYSLVKYKRSESRVIIQCSVHGEFTQRAYDHLRGNGCPSCARRGFIPSKGGWLYYIKFYKNDFVFYKVGITNGDIKTRIRRFQVDKKFKFEILFSKWYNNGYDAQSLERKILTENKQFKYENAAQYMKNGFSETFIKDILGWIKL